VKGITNHHDAIANHIDVSDDFIRRVLGNPTCTVEQASYSAHDLEQDRECMRQDEIRADYLRHNLRAVK
jgi:hypothetical protein